MSERAWWWLYVVLMLLGAIWLFAQSAHAARNGIHDEAIYDLLRGWFTVWLLERTWVARRRR